MQLLLNISFSFDSLEKIKQTYRAPRQIQKENVNGINENNCQIFDLLHVFFEVN